MPCEQTTQNTEIIVELPHQGCVVKGSRRVIAGEDDARGRTDLLDNGTAMKMLDGTSGVAEDTANCCCPHSDDDSGLNKVDFKVKPMRTGGYFGGMGSPVLRGPTMDGVADIDFITANTAGREETVKLLTGFTEKWNSVEIFLDTWRFPD
jgi:hypothetical protein